MLLAAPTNQALRETAFKLFLQYGHPDAAVDVAEEGLKLDPTNADLWDLLSNAQATIGNFPKAIDALEQVYENDPSKADSTYYLKITVFAAAQPDTVRLLKWARLGVDKPENVAARQLVITCDWRGCRTAWSQQRRLIAVDTTAVTPALAAAKTLAEQKKVTQALPFTDFAVRYGDADAKENAAAILTNGAVPMLQQPGQDLPGAAETLRRAVAAANPSGRVAPSANYLLVRRSSGAADWPAGRGCKSCDLADRRPCSGSGDRAPARQGARRRKPTRISASSGNSSRVASMLSAYCK
jgi:tetratricopeptide (TPR) repeat protein